MIDDPVTSGRLLDKLADALPIAASMTPEMHVMLRQRLTGGPIPMRCNVISVRYMGDEGGIVCQLDLGPDIQDSAFASITHLRFAASLALAREITVYQKRRVKRLRRYPGPGRT